MKKESSNNAKHSNKIVLYDKTRDYEFSKRVITFLVYAWFIGLVFAFIVNVFQMIYCIIFQYEITISIGETLAYIGAPMTGGVLGYLIKSAIDKKFQKPLTKEEYESIINSACQNNNSEINVEILTDYTKEMMDNKLNNINENGLNNINDNQSV